MREQLPKHQLKQLELLIQKKSSDNSIYINFFLKPKWEVSNEKPKSNLKCVCKICTSVIFILIIYNTEDISSDVQMR